MITRSAQSELGVLPAVRQPPCNDVELELSGLWDARNGHRAFGGVVAEVVAEVVEAAGEAIWAVDLAGRVRYANPRAAEMLEARSPSDLIGQSLTDLLFEDGVPEVGVMPTDQPADRRVTCERRFLRTDGSVMWLQVTETPVRGSTGVENGSVVAATDITEARETAAEMLQRARTDRLTGMMNAGALKDALQTLLESRDVPLALLLVDVSGVEEAAEDLGDDAADEVLLELANRLARLRRQADLVARTGPSRFVVVARDIGPPNDASGFARAVLEATTEPCSIMGFRLAPRTSIGMALAPADSTAAVDLLRHAEAALRGARREGARWKRYDPASDRERRARQRLILDLNDALGDDRLSLQFQPQVNLSTGSPHRVEALARWRHPARGLVPRSDFMPLVERVGLARRYTGWALASALSSASQWRAEGTDVGVAVRVANGCFEGRWLYDTVTESLARTGMPPSYLTLGIDERCLVELRDPLVNVLHDLRMLGVGVSVEAFGTGGCALSAFQDLPVDEIKIDPSFIVRLAGDRRVAAVVRTMVQLAENLDLWVVADGVDSPAGLAALRDLGCVAQGAAICPPKTVLDVPGWWRANQRHGPPTSR